MTDKRQRLVRRLSAVLIGITGVAAVAMLVILPLIDAWESTSDSIDRASRLLEGYRHVAADRDLTTRRLDSLRQQDSRLDGFIGGATSALALASLQSEVKQIVEAHGGKIQSMQPGAVVSNRGFDRIDVKLDVSVAGEAFAELVAALDSHRPALSVDPLELHVPEGGAPSDHLTIRMTVSAYRRSVTS